MICFFCHQDLQITDRIGRQEACPHCGRDLHICKNCEFYDESAYNECREPQAERVVDKEKSNFCDYFVFGRSNRSVDSRDAATVVKRKLEELFKK